MDNGDEVFPGISIRAALVSPITNEIYFVDGQNRLVHANDLETAQISLEFITPEDMEII